MTAIRLITDSSSDCLPDKKAGLKVVPLTISLGTDSYVDDNQLVLPHFWQKMKENQETGRTACPSLDQWLTALDGCSLAIIVTLTSALSGTYEAALQARKIYLARHPHAKIIAVDSRSAGPEIALILRGVEEMIARKPRFVDLDQMIAQYRLHTHLLFELQSLHNLAVNGRVNPSLAKLANLLRINLIGKASQAGKLEPLLKIRGQKRALTGLWRQMQKLNYQGGTVIIDQCAAAEEANALKKKIRASFPAAKIIVRPTRGLCSFYVEQGGLMVAFKA